jgi:hypothetical protein
MMTNKFHKSIATGRGSGCCLQRFVRRVHLGACGVKKRTISIKAPGAARPKQIPIAVAQITLLKRLHQRNAIQRQQPPASNMAAAEKSNIGNSEEAPSKRAAQTENKMMELNNAALTNTRV